MEPKDLNLGNLLWKYVRVIGKNKHMEKIKQYKYVILILLVILGFLFYWFQLMPANIRKACIRKYPNAFYVSPNTNTENINPFAGLLGSDKSNYEKCLRQSGIEK